MQHPDFGRRGFRAPILVAAYLTGTAAPAAKRNEALAEIGRIIAGSLPGV